MSLNTCQIVAKKEMGEWRVFCLVENQAFPVLDFDVPTKCPNNPTHAIDPDRTVLVRVIPRNPGSSDAIVAQDGTGDFLHVADAFNAGAVNVLVRRGIYYETDDVRIPDSGLLSGENAGLFAMVFPTGKSCIVDGSGGVMYTTGTISVNTGSTIVNGTGTTFLSMPSSAFVLMGGQYYQLGAIMSNTVAVLQLPYMGRPLVNQPLKAQTMYTGTSLRNIVIIGGTGTGLIYRGVRHGTLQSIALKYNHANAIFDGCCAVGVRNFVSESSRTHGVVVQRCDQILLEGMGSKNCWGDGLQISDSRSVFLNNCTFTACLGNGVTISDCSVVSITDAGMMWNSHNGLTTTNAGSLLLDSLTVHKNGGHGIVVGLCSEAVGSNISSCMVSYNGGNGVSVTDNSTIDACHVNSNGGSGLEIPVGNGVLISDNQVENNGVHGMNLYNATLCNATGNRVFQNGQAGVLLGPSSLRNIVANNHVISNGSADIQDLGNGNMINNNIV